MLYLVMRELFLNKML